MTEEGGLSGEPSPRFSGEMHGDIGEEGDSFCYVIFIIFTSITIIIIIIVIVCSPGRRTETMGRGEIFLLC